MNSQTPNTLFYKYKQIRSSLDLPPKLIIYFDLLEHSLTQKITQKQLKKKQAFATEFIRGFMTLSKNQKQLMLFQYIQKLSKFCQTFSLNDEMSQKKSKFGQCFQDETKQKDLQNIQQKCKVNGQILGIPFWHSADFYLNFKQKNIMITIKHSILLDLRLYLIRRSKKHQNTLILESISNMTQKNYNKVSIYLKEGVFQRVYDSISEYILKYRSQQIINLYVQGTNDTDKQLPFLNDSDFQMSYTNRPLIFLNEININQYLCWRGMINTHLLSIQDKYFPIYQNSLYTIFKSSEDPSVYKLESKMTMDQPSAKNKFMSSLKNYKFIKLWQILQSFSVKYEAILQKYKFIDKKINQIMIKQVNFSNTLAQQVMFLKHVDNIINKSFMQFCSFKIRQLDKKTSKLILIGCFNPHLLGGIQNLIILLQEYVLMMDRTQTPQFSVTKATNEQFHSILDTFMQSPKKGKKQELLNQIKEDQEIQVKEKNIYNKNSLIKQLKQSPQTYLTHKYKMNPIQKSQVEDAKQTQNFLYTEWRRAKNGGLVCVDEQKLKQQKAIGKKILAKFGNQIFKGKGIMSVSLPVQIFKKQSQLQTLAKNFTFAPQIMQQAIKKNDHIQVLKASTAFLLTNNILGLNVEKPFNPILGETFQCSINGCPLYLEQTSHHPPISAYYFVGRGYKLYGSVQPKISLGMNGAKGYSDTIHTLQLDNGTVMEMLISKMNISGLLFGQRIFNYEGQSYLYDKTNNYFSDMFFGPLKTSIFGSNSDPDDYVSGKIYKVNATFAKYYQQNKSNIKIQKEHIVDVVCQYSGLWTQYLSIDKKTVLNFKSNQPDSPYLVEPETFYLPSQSRLRDDLRLLIDENIQKAQQAKQRMEEDQRKDRKLRKQYDNND